MKLYEIDQQILSILEQVDPETGELTDEQFNQLTELNLDREAKIDNLASWYKQTTAEAEAIRNEERTLAERRRVKANQAENIKQYLAFVMAGDKLETPRNRISWRRSQSVDITDETQIPEEFLVPQPAKVSKSEISQAIKAGREVPGAMLIEKQNIQIR